MGNTGLALAELDSLIPEPSETDLIVFRNYYLKLIQLSQSLSSWSQISAADFAYFVSISESFTPTASKAKCLIKEIMNASTNQSLMKRKVNTSNESEPIVLQVYPNPLKDKIYIKNNIALQIFEIYDLNGALIEKGNLSGEQAEINLVHLKIAQYVLILTDKSGKTYHRVIVKN
jgi:hypothetical protein